MSIRPYLPEDWQLVCEIYDLSKPDELAGLVAANAIRPLNLDPSMKSLFAESRVCLAEIEARPVGFAGNRGSLIAWLFVHPEFRRAGVARALLTHLLEDIERPVALNVASGNTRARSLYGQFGFSVEREFMGSFQGTPCPVTRLVLA